MADENDSAKHEVHSEPEKKMVVKHKGGSSGIVGAAYFMAFIGAAVYYIQGTTTFGAGFIGFLKAIVWPAMLIFDLLKYLHMQHIEIAAIYNGGMHKMGDKSPRDKEKKKPKKDKKKQ